MPTRHQTAMKTVAGSRCTIADEPRKQQKSTQDVQGRLYRRRGITSLFMMTSTTNRTAAVVCLIRSALSYPPRSRYAELIRDRPPTHRRSARRAVETRSEEHTSE